MGVVGDVFDEGFGGGVEVRGGGFGVRGEVCGGDLESVEEEAGAFGVDVGSGDAGEDVVEGELDAGPIVDGGHLEDCCFVGAAVGDGGLLAGGVVVEAEVLSAKGGGAAAAAFGEDVAAEVAAFGVGLVGFGELEVHGGISLGRVNGESQGTRS